MFDTCEQKKFRLLSVTSKTIVSVIAPLFLVLLCVIVKKHGIWQAIC